MEIKKPAFVIIIVALALSIVANACLAFVGYKSIKKLAEQEKFQQQNAKLFLFRNLFTKNIILSNESVDFENRLKMEEAARDLNDPQIFALWQNFVKSKTSEEVNAHAKELLNVLIDKTGY